MIVNDCICESTMPRYTRPSLQRDGSIATLPAAIDHHKTNVFRPPFHQIVQQHPWQLSAGNRFTYRFSMQVSARLATSMAAALMLAYNLLIASAGKYTPVPTSGTAKTAVPYMRAKRIEALKSIFCLVGGWWK